MLIMKNEDSKKENNMKRIGINGWSGFIGSNLIKEFEINYPDIEIVKLNRILSEDDIRDLDKIVLLSGPSETEEFQKLKETSESMMENYIFNLMLIKKYKPSMQIFFGSAQSVEDQLVMEEQSCYAIFKMAIERYIVATLNNWTIIRTPRVYGQERNKGLMKKIKRGDKLNSHKIIAFKDVDTFVQELAENIHGSFEHGYQGYLEFECEHHKTVYQIKELYGF